MENLKLAFDIDISVLEEGKREIRVINNEEKIMYKFLVGQDGIWKKIKDYSEDNSCIWKPDGEGKYTVMVQSKDNKSRKPFDNMLKQEVIINKKKNIKLIEDIKLSEKEYLLGEKIQIEIISDFEMGLYRFWEKKVGSWSLVCDYRRDKNLTILADKQGVKEILVEAKNINSREISDEYSTLRIRINPLYEVKITNFIALNKKLLINEPLIFKVDTNIDNKRNILFKFIKIDSYGKRICIQDYSSSNILEYKERLDGNYRLLCLVKDMLSDKDYDDRAVMIYEVKPYKAIKVKSFSTDLKSPQLSGTEIKLKADIEGGRELLYKFVIEGSLSVDTGYIRNKNYVWNTKIDGEYLLTVYAKDISSSIEYEDKETISYIIDHKADKPVRIIEVTKNNSKNILVGSPFNLKVKTEGGTDISYAFIVYKDGVEKERIDYGKSNWANFIPEEKGKYEMEIRVKDKYSSKDYDSNVFIKISANDYIPSVINQVLIPVSCEYVVGNSIDLEVLCKNTVDTEIKYITKIEGRLIQNTEYIRDKKINIKFKTAGKYSFEILAKNINSDKNYDSKKEINIFVEESIPIRDTKVYTNKKGLKVNEDITFYAESLGGKDICYEFYIMEKGNWSKVQSYSRKNYYTFMPFISGDYKIMVIAKSFYKRVNYEDYNELSFKVV